MGLIDNAIPFAPIVWSQRRPPSGLAAILNAATPLWTMLVGRLAASEEQAAPEGIAGALLGFAGVEAMRAALGQMTAPAAMMLPVALAADHPWALPAPSAASLAAILGLALFSTAPGCALCVRIPAPAGAVNLLPVTFLAPVSATLPGTPGLGEGLEPRHLLGMAPIGLAAIDGRALAYASRRFRS